MPPADLLSGDVSVGQEVAPPSPDHKNPAHASKAERAAHGETAFSAKYGTNKNGANAFGKCGSSSH